MCLKDTLCTDIRGEDLSLDFTGIVDFPSKSLTSLVIVGQWWAAMVSLMGRMNFL